LSGAAVSNRSLTISKAPFVVLDHARQEQADRILSFAFSERPLLRGKHSGISISWLDMSMPCMCCIGRETGLPWRSAFVS
jgi:hypothetical protein